MAQTLGCRAAIPVRGPFLHRPLRKAQARCRQPKRRPPTHVRHFPIATAPASRKERTSKTTLGRKLHSYVVNKGSARMHAPACWCLDFLCTLSAKGHPEGAHQGTLLLLTNTHTRAPTQMRRRQATTKDDELLAEQARSQRSDVRRDMSWVLVFGA